LLHNTTREALLQTRAGYTALVADALYSIGFQPYHEFRLDEAITALTALKTSRKVIALGLNHELFSPRGRRYRVYTMPAPSTARKIVGAADLSIRDELPDSAYASLPDYRRALHHALIKRKPGLYKRYLLARRLGVCKRTTANYDRIIGHKVEAQFLSRPITAGDIDAMPTVKIKGGKKQRWLVLVDQDGWIEKEAPLVKAIALKWLKDGGRVEVKEQIANYYQPSQISRYAQTEYADYLTV